MREYRGTVSLMLVDVDQHQELSERMGPAIAELVAETISGFLTSSLGKADSIVRLAKGQFAVTLPGTQLPGAMDAGTGAAHDIFLSHAVARCGVAADA